MDEEARAPLGARARFIGEAESVICGVVLFSKNKPQAHWKRPHVTLILMVIGILPFTFASIGKFNEAAIVMERACVLTIRPNIHVRFRRTNGQEWQAASHHRS